MSQTANHALNRTAARLRLAMMNVASLSSMIQWCATISVALFLLASECQVDSGRTFLTVSGIQSICPAIDSAPQIDCRRFRPWLLPISIANGQEAIEIEKKQEKAQSEGPEITMECSCDQPSQAPLPSRQQALTVKSRFHPLRC